MEKVLIGNVKGLKGQDGEPGKDGTGSSNVFIKDQLQSKVSFSEHPQNLLDKKLDKNVFPYPTVADTGSCVIVGENGEYKLHKSTDSMIPLWGSSWNEKMTSYTIKIEEPNTTVSTNYYNNIITWGDGNSIDKNSHIYTKPGYYTIISNGILSDFKPKEVVIYITGPDSYGFPINLSNSNNINNFPNLKDISHKIVYAPSYYGDRTAYAFKNNYHLKYLDTVPTWGELSDINTQGMYQNCYELLKIKHNPRSRSGTANLNSTFENCYKLQDIDSVYSCWGAFKDLTRAFKNCYNLLLPTDFFVTTGHSVITTEEAFKNNWRLEKTYPFHKGRGNSNYDSGKSWKSAKSMYEDCKNLKECIPKTFGYDAYIEDFSYCFKGCSALTILPSSFSSYYGVNMQHMFDGCASLKTTTSFGWGSVTDISYMYANCSKLESISNGKRNMPKLINATGAYLNCSSITQVQTWTTPVIENLTETFRGCSSLLLCPTLNIQTATSTLGMFQDCIKLEKVGRLETPVVTDSSYMFYNCKNLSVIDLFDFKSVINAENMFYNCYKLEDVHFININVDLDLSAAEILPKTIVLDILNNLVKQESNITKTIKFSLNVKNLLTAEDILIATNKGWEIQ